jgi:two-component system invasion response regulator UvrY
MIRVLIADDHKLIRAGLKLTLSDEDDIAVTCEAENGLDALHLVKTNDLDTVILDISMPGMNGLDVSTEVRKLYPSLPVLILSVLSEEAYASKSLKAGASGFVHKEKIPEELVSAIRKVANGGIYLSPALTEKVTSNVGNHVPKFLYKHLTLVEFQVMTSLATGKPIVGICKNLSISPEKITSLNSCILEKLGMKDNSELLNYCIEEGLL